MKDVSIKNKRFWLLKKIFLKTKIKTVKLQKLGTNVWQIWPKKQKYKSDLMHNSEYQLCRVFVPNDLVEKKY